MPAEDFLTWGLKSGWKKPVDAEIATKQNILRRAETIKRYFLNPRGCAIQKTDQSWKAKWIWTRGSTHRPFHFSYFRKTFIAREHAARARFYCAADSKYRLWVNGKYAGSGPARGHPGHPYYDTYLLPLLKGPNTIAFLVEHYSAGSAMFAAVEGGLWCQVEAGNSVLAATDRSWKGCVSKAYRALPGLLFPESFDARREPAGWHNPGFNDSAWLNAVELFRTKLAPPARFRPRPIPLLSDRRLPPARVVGAGTCRSENAVPCGENTIAASMWRMTLSPAGKGQFRPGLKAPCPWSGRPISILLEKGGEAYIALDFGMETLAAPEIRVRGPGGMIIDLGYSECLWNNRVAMQWQSPSISQAERIILRRGITCHRINQPRGFRFMLVRAANPTGARGTVTLESVCAHETIYPARARGKFTCSDSLLDRIFRMSARTVNLCMEDAYTDCPWRERSQWIGDAQPETLFSYYCFGAYALARKAVREFTSGNTPEGWIPGIFPVSRPINLPTWGMRVPVIAWEYYLYSGDYETLKEAYGGVRRQMDWFARHAGRDALVSGMGGWNFVDWTRTDSRCPDGAVQGWYLEALECSAKIARAVGDQTACMHYLECAARLRSSLAKLYWSASKKAFRKYRHGSPDLPPGADPEMLGQHENFLFVLLGVGTPAQRRQALDAMRGVAGRYLPNLGDYQSTFLPENKGNYIGENIMRIGTPFWSYYALLALMESGRAGAALEYIRLCWGLMLEFGATSCWEMWDRHTSLCHGWSAAPAMILPAYVLGIKPLSPGFRMFAIRPRFADLAWAEGRVPTPSGTIVVSWRMQDDETWRCRVHVPRGLEGVFSWDTHANGRASLATMDGRGMRMKGRCVISPGGHELVVRRSFPR